MSRAISLPKVDRRDPTPKYLQAREILIDAIRTGRLAPGTKLPSTKEISALFDISLITAHKALEGLVESGWLRREVGRGTYVRDDIDPAHAAQQLHVALVLEQSVNLDDYYHSTLLNGLRREAQNDTHRVEFFFHDRFDLRDKGNRHVGALCIHPALEDRAAVEQLAARHPVVVLGGTLPDSDIPAVDCDNEGGARAAVRHLIDLGHRRFLVLSGPMNLTNARDRAIGAAAELTAHGIPLADRDRPVSRDSVVLDEDARAFLHRRFREPARPTAIIAGGFYLALAAIQIIRQAGLSIPRDVSIIGFDDPPSAPLLDPPLTAVRQPLTAMAAEAYRRIRDAILGQTPGEPLVHLATELVIRGSTGRAP